MTALLDRPGLVAGIRSRHYSAAPTAALAYQAEALTPLDAAASASVGGTTVIRHASLSTGWTPVLSTQIAGVGQMTHTGSYRVWARVQTTSATPPRLRLLWDVGDLVAPVTNPAVSVPGSNAFYLVNLGAVRLDAPPVGTHRWQGAIQAAGAAAGDNVSIDRVWLFPVDEGYGELRAAGIVRDGPGLAGYAARDEFIQTGGALTGKTLAVGGTWAGAGDADDFTVDAVAHRAQRTAVSDTLNLGRHALAGASTLAATVASVDFSFSRESNVLYLGVLLRYVDANNYLMAVFAPQIAPNNHRVRVLANVAGSLAAVIDTTSGVPRLAPNTMHNLTAAISTPGRTTIWLNGVEIARPADARFLAASGRVGIYDEYQEAGACTRTYDNFVAYVPGEDAVINPNLAAELRTDGIYRQSADGGGYGPVSHIIGDLPRLPASGMEGRVSEVILLPSRGEPGAEPAPGADAISAHVYARPSWLFVPDA